MKLRTENALRWSPLVVGSLLLTLLLSACNFGFGGNSSASATPTAQPAPTQPAPTQSSASTLTTYTGDGFTIGYPAGWTAKQNATGVVLSDSTGVATLAVELVPNPNGSLPIAPLIQNAMNSAQGQGKNFQTVPIAPTTTVGGDSWSQAAATGDSTRNGQTVNMKIVVLADNHPANAANTRTYLIVYGTATRLFDTANTTLFQPMLQSFKFA
ncbi:MAG: hypothetical protein JOZ18_23795 [Chloroflexi bacterium]|nr:hypothetical protein [Chloroflexota bacterium]